MKELDCIRKACSLSDTIFSALVKEFRKKSFSTEKDVYTWIVQRVKDNKCGLAFKPLVVTGKNAAEIHHKADDTPLGKGFLIIDLGVKYKGYCSDCTRMLFLGKPTKEDRKLYDLVLMAEETAILYCQPGVYAADVDLIARAALWGYFRHFVHALGHGVGKRVHKGPVLKPSSRSILKKGQIITIEPGLYFKGKKGIRIEDTIVVLEKPEVLTRFTKRLICCSYN